MRRLLATTAGFGLAFGLAATAPAADDQYFDDDLETREGSATITTTTTTVHRVDAASVEPEGYPESDWRDEGKDPRNLLPHENPLKSVRWAEDMGQPNGPDDDR